jgi:hypothetical protein
MRRTLLAVLPFLLLGCSGSQRTETTGSTVAGRASPPVHAVAPSRLVPTPAGQLAAPVQDPAAAPFAGGAVLLGGLTAADVSTDAIVTATRAGTRRAGTLPGALHDAAAVTIGRLSYLFGGGNGIA